MASSTPTRSRRESREEDAHSGRPVSRESAHLDAMVRFQPRDLLRLYASAEMRDLWSLTSAARQISAARNRPAVPTSQASSFEILRNSQTVSPAESATRGKHRSRRNSPPNQANNSLRSLPPVTRAAGLHESAHEDPAGYVLVKAVTQLAVHIVNAGHDDAPLRRNARRAPARMSERSRRTRSRRCAPLSFPSAERAHPHPTRRCRRRWSSRSRRIRRLPRHSPFPLSRRSRAPQTTRRTSRTRRRPCHLCRPFSPQSPALPRSRRTR